MDPRAAMMRAVVLAAIALAGCNQDACAGLDGTCVALTVTGQGEVDGVAITLSGAATGTRFVPPVASVHPLPVVVALHLPSVASTSLHVGVLGVLLGQPVGKGQVDVTLVPAGRTAATVLLSAAPTGGDGGAPLPSRSDSDGGFSLRF